MMMSSTKLEIRTAWSL